jgi:hypothetical protein
MLPTWEALKENVQPIKSGRSAQRLSSALSGAGDDQKQRDAAERCSRARTSARGRSALSCSSPNRSKSGLGELEKTKRDSFPSSMDLEQKRESQQGGRESATVAPARDARASRLPVNTATACPKDGIEATAAWWEARVARAVEEVPADPLGVWIAYIRWRQEAFPSGGSRAQLSSLMERALRNFAQKEASPLMECYIEEYRNDPRYVRLWVQYADMCADPTEIFLYMRAQGIGQELALFYEAFASVLEAKHQFAMADRCYTEGVERGAIPLERLRRRHEEFQARMVRRLERQQRNQHRTEPPRTDQAIRCTGARSSPTNVVAEHASDRREPFRESVSGPRPALATIGERGASPQAAQTDGWPRVSRSREPPTARPLWQGDAENRPPLQPERYLSSGRPQEHSFAVHAEDLVQSQSARSDPSTVLPITPEESGFSASALRFPSVNEARQENRGRIQPWNQVCIVQDPGARAGDRLSMAEAMPRQVMTRAAPFQVYIEEEHDHGNEHASQLQPSRSPTEADAMACLQLNPSPASRQHENDSHASSPQNGIECCLQERAVTPRASHERGDTSSFCPPTIGPHSLPDTPPLSDQPTPPGAEQDTFCHSRDRARTPCSSSSSSSSSPSPGSIGRSHRLAGAAVASPTVHTRLALADIESMFNSPLPFEREADQPAPAANASASEHPTALRQAAASAPNTADDSPSIEQTSEYPRIVSRPFTVEHDEGSLSEGPLSASDTSPVGIEETLSEKENHPNDGMFSKTAPRRSAHRSFVSEAAILAEIPQSPVKESDFIVVEEHLEPWITNEHGTRHHRFSLLDAEITVASAEMLPGATGEDGDLNQPPADRTTPPHGTSWSRVIRAEGHELPVDDALPTEQSPDSTGAQPRFGSKSSLVPRLQSAACRSNHAPVSQSASDASSVPSNVPAEMAWRLTECAAMTYSGVNAAETPSSVGCDIPKSSSSGTIAASEPEHPQQVAASDQVTNIEAMSLPEKSSPAAATPSQVAASSTRTNGENRDRFQPHLSTPERDAFWNDMEESTTSHASLLQPQDFTDEAASASAWYLDISIASPLAVDQAQVTPPDTMPASQTLLPSNDRQSVLPTESQSPTAVVTTDRFLGASAPPKVIDTNASVERSVGPAMPAVQTVSTDIADAISADCLGVRQATTLEASTEATSEGANQSPLGPKPFHQDDSVACERAGSAEYLCGAAQLASASPPASSPLSIATATIPAACDVSNANLLGDRISSVVYPTPLSPILEECEHDDNDSVPSLDASQACSPEWVQLHPESAPTSASSSSSIAPTETSEQGAFGCVTMVTGEYSEETSTPGQRLRSSTATMPSATSSDSVPASGCFELRSPETTALVLLRPFASTLRQRFEHWLQAQLSVLAPDAYHLLACTPDLQEHTCCWVQLADAESSPLCWSIQSALSGSGQGNIKNGSSSAEHAAYYTLLLSAGDDAGAASRNSWTPPTSSRAHAYRPHRSECRVRHRSRTAFASKQDKRGERGQEPRILKVQPAAGGRSEFVLLRRLWQPEQPHLDSPTPAWVLRSLPYIEALYEASDTQTAYLLLHQLPSWGTLADLQSLIAVPGYVDRVHDQHPAGWPTGQGLDPVFVGFIARELLRLLGYIHGSAIIHWHIRPESIWFGLGAENRQPVIVLADWHQALDLSLLAALEAKPESPLPEVVCRGGWVPSPYRCPSMQQQQPWAFDLDLYATACTLWSLLCGHQRPLPRRQEDLAHRLSVRETRLEALTPTAVGAGCSPTAWIEPVISTLATVPTIKRPLESQRLCQHLIEHFLDPLCDQYKQRIHHQARAYAWLLAASRDALVTRRAPVDRSP